MGPHVLHGVQLLLALVNDGGAPRQVVGVQLHLGHLQPQVQQRLLNAGLLRLLDPLRDVLQKGDCGAG